MGFTKGIILDLGAVEKLCEDAAFENRPWEDALQAIAQWVDGDKVMLLGARSSGAYNATLIHNHDPDGLARYNSGYNLSDPRRAHSWFTPVGGTGLGQAFVSNAAIAKSAYYSDITLPFDVKDSVHGIIADDEFGRTTISVQRCFKREYFDADDSRKLEVVLPILQRNLRASRLLSAAASNDDFLGNAYGCLISSEMEFRPVGGTIPAQLAKRGFAIGAANGRFLFGASHFRNAFLQGFGSAKAGSSAQCLLNDLSYTFLPVPTRLKWLADDVFEVLLTVGKPRPWNTVDLFARAYDFTESETSLLRQMVEGRKLRDSAQQVGIKYETARWHMKNMCSKSGHTRSRALILAARGGHIADLI